MVVGYIELTVNPRHLAHCRLCYDPMYCIYDTALRPYCWECECEAIESGEVPVKGPSASARLQAARRR